MEFYNVARFCHNLEFAISRKIRCDEFNCVKKEANDNIFTFCPINGFWQLSIALLCKCELAGRISLISAACVYSYLFYSLLVRFLHLHFSFAKLFLFREAFRCSLFIFFLHFIWMHSLLMPLILPLLLLCIFMLTIYEYFSSVISLLDIFAILALPSLQSSIFAIVQNRYNLLLFPADVAHITFSHKCVAFFALLYTKLHASNSLDEIDKYWFGLWFTEILIRWTKKGRENWTKKTKSYSSHRYFLFTIPHNFSECKM